MTYELWLRKTKEASVELPTEASLHAAGNRSGVPAGATLSVSQGHTVAKPIRCIVTELSDTDARQSARHRFRFGGDA